MANSTKPYHRSMSLTFGSGTKSLFGGSGKRYYTLVYKNQNDGHAAGYSEQIIVDNAELGRDPKCQIRIDQHFETVSRRHAVIVKDGEQWKIVHLGINPTIVNGQPLTYSGQMKYLQNGDEIQLSINGPKFGFVVPEGKSGLVSSIGLSRRLELFRKQAMRPYKQALTALSCIMVLCVGAATYKIMEQNATIYEQVKKTNELYDIAQAIKDRIEIAERERSAWERHIKDSLQRVFEADIDRRINDIALQPAPQSMQNPDNVIASLLQTYHNDVLYMEAVVCTLKNGEMEPVIFQFYNEQEQCVNIPYAWSGSAFLLNDGKLVTARHCVQGWRFSSERRIVELEEIARSEGAELIALISAISKNGKRYVFTSKDCVLDDSNDEPIEHIFEDGPLSWKTAITNTVDSDWAYYQTNDIGHLTADATLSKNLIAATPLHIMGYPLGMGAENINRVTPGYTNVNVAFDGLNYEGNIIHTGGTEQGNSGGPVMVYKDNKLVVVGIVSRSAGPTSEYNIATPIAAIR